MALTPSNMLPLGTVAPAFQLPDTVTGQEMSLSQLRGDKATVIMFISNHCPYVKHIQQGLVALAADYQEKGVAFVAISANDVENYPEDSPQAMAQEAQTAGYDFPYLYDESQQVARAYQAACTPDFYLFDDGLRCVYRGRMDEARPGNTIPVTGQDLRAALDALLSGAPVSDEQHPSVGCNIKWRG